jgi:hypothetical protein
VIALSRLCFTFKKGHKAGNGFFRLYLEENLADPLNVNGLPVFVSKESGGLSPVYESTMLPVGSDTYVFPDVVRILLEKPLKQTARLVVHFMLTEGKAANVIRLATYSLFVDGQVIASTRHCSLTFEPKAINTSDYVQRHRNLKKGYKFHFTIDIPKVFFPPPIFAQLMEAQHPNQVDWGLLKDSSSPDIAIDQLIPVVYK